MLSALKTANFFIYLMPEDENELTNLKINKLLFYAQGHSLKRFSKHFLVMKFKRGNMDL